MTVKLQRPNAEPEITQYLSHIFLPYLTGFQVTREEGSLIPSLHMYNAFKIEIIFITILLVLFIRHSV